MPTGKYGFSGVLRIVSKDECYNMSEFKEELHTNGSRCILILENVSAIDRGILMKGSQYVSLSSEQSRNREHEHSIQSGESCATVNSVFFYGNYTVSCS